MSIKMRGKRLGVEKLGRASNDKGFLAMPEDTSSVGTIKYVGQDVQDSNLKLGAKVHFGKQYHQVKMNGSDILVMDEDNVYAVVEESTSN